MSQEALKDRKRLPGRGSMQLGWRRKGRKGEERGGRKASQSEEGMCARDISEDRKGVAWTRRPGIERNRKELNGRRPTGESCR